MEADALDGAEADVLDAEDAADVADVWIQDAANDVPETSPSCEAGAAQCSDAGYYVCSADGGWTKAIAPCGSRCAEGESQPSTIVLFGGLGAQSVLGDTWVFGGESQSWSSPDLGIAADASGSPGIPGPRAYAAMSTACGYAVLTGGIDVNWLDDAWLWNGASWQIAPSAPPARESAAAATLGTSMYLFGGLDPSDTPEPDLFAWSGGNWALAPLDPDGPAARYGASFVNNTDALLLFGGFDVEGNAISDTWELTGAGWVLESDSGAPVVPNGRFDAAAARWQGEVVVFGGQDSNYNVLGDTLVWNGLTWNSQQGGPPARYSAMMSALNGYIVLFGGVDINGDMLGDTWIWNGTWTPGPVAGPPGRSGAAMTAY